MEGGSYQRLSLILRALYIGGVQQLVSLMAVGLAEELIVKLLDIGILVALADGLILILNVKSLGALGADIAIAANGSADDRLTAAVYAAARAAHDFDEVILLLAGLYGIEKLSSAARGGGDGDANVDISNLYGGFLNSLNAADSGEVHILKGLAGNLISGTQSGFHNSAGCAEDYGSAGGRAEHRIEILVSQLHEVDACHLNHLCKLAGGDDLINIRLARSGQLRALCLELLRGAGHDGNNLNVLLVPAHLIRIIALDDSAFHLVGALAGAEIRDELGIIGFAELNPSGRAAGNHRENPAVVHAVEQLGGFLHDGKVSAEVGIEHLLEAKATQSGGKLAGAGRSHRHSEFLAEGGADGGSGLNDNVLGLILKQLPYIVRGILLAKRSDRANVDALTAVDAGSFVKLHVPSGSDGALEATVASADNANLLDVIADGYAAAAKDALVVIADDGRREVINLVLVHASGEHIGIVNAKLLAQRLQLAALAAGAGEALLLMVGEEQLKDNLARLTNLRGVGLDNHIGAYGQNAGGLKRAGAGIYYAHTASAKLC